jgi:hypothetical protein
MSSQGDRLEMLVDVVVRAAQLNGAALTLIDLLQLLQPGTTSEGLAQAFESHPRLSKEFVLSEGFVVGRVGSHPPVSDHDERQNYFAVNVRAAKWLSERLEAVIVAVSGSTSYRTATHKDDVDLFCVTRREEMWVFLARALILTRVSRLLDKSRVPICLSCVMDESYARKLFSSDRGALFARDALVAEVVRGRERYDSLLESASWIGRYFPKLYGLKMSTRGRWKGTDAARSSWTRVANLFLFITLGSYIRAKAQLHNKLLAKQGKGLSLFHVRIDLDHLIYESTKYLRLREMYDEIQPISGEVHGRIASGGLLEPIWRPNEAR